MKIVTHANPQLDPVPSSNRAGMVRVGQLHVSLEHREIRLNGELVRIGSRAFDILETLIAGDGELVSKDALMQRVWPDTIVEENNLQVQIAAVRKILDRHRDLIVTVPGRGYRLTGVAKVSEADEAPQGEGAPVRQRSGRHNLPQHASALIGRQSTVTGLLEYIDRARILTLTGSGGIGKTRLAIEAARALLPMFADGVAFVSLAPVSHPQFALDALATALNTRVSCCDLSLAHVAHEMHGKQMLIVLDNCEHVVETAAAMADVLAAASDGIRVLATSREALRARDEVVYQVPPLDVPSPENRSDEVLQAGAVQLFLSRARAIDPHFSSDERSVFLTGEVCRRLDGIPLAIELAAARAAALGIEVLAARLDDRLGILSGGCRTALPRQQTLKATLDWSYRLLNETERVILRRLGVFVDTFTFDSICSVGASIGFEQTVVMDALGGLVSKSLVIRTDGSADSSRTPGYRLLETTRAYALQQLEDNGEQRAAALAHATWFCERFKPTQAEGKVGRAAGQLEAFRLELGNVRAALDWAFSASGNRAIGIELSAIAVPYLFDLSQVGECYSRAQLALDAARETDDIDVSGEARLTLATTLAASMVYTHGPSRQVLHAWSEVLAMAVNMGNITFEIRALCGLWHASQTGGKARQALAFARRFDERARPLKDVTHTLIGRRLEGVALHYLGEQGAARQKLEAMLSAWVPSTHRWDTVGARIEHGIVAQAMLARVMWAQGETSLAMRHANEALDAALRHDFELVTCYVLGESFIPLALLTGDLSAAERGIATLKCTSSRASLPIWLACSTCYEEHLHSLSAEAPHRLAKFRHALDGLRALGLLAPLTLLQCQLAGALMREGRYGDALAAVNEALRQCDETGEQWYYAELCRVKGELTRVTQGGADAAAWFTAALESARRQGATVLALRAARSLARFWAEQNRADDAHGLLSSILSDACAHVDGPDIDEARAALVELEKAISETSDT